MPRYVTITPTFNPISTQEYLQVPMLLAKEYEAEQEKVENYKDRLSYIRHMMGDKGDKVFESYDALMNSISEDPSLRNMRDTGQRLRDIYREIGSRAELAKANMDRYQSMFDKDPSLIGDVGTFMDYYENPEFRPAMISGKELDTQIGGLTANEAATILPRSTGQFYGDPRNKQEIYATGIDPDNLKRSLVRAVTRQPDLTSYEAGLRDYLDSIDFDNLPNASKQRVLRAMQASMEANSGFGYNIYDGLKYANMRSQMSHRGSGSGSRGGGRGGSGSGRTPQLAFTTASARPRNWETRIVDHYTVETDPTTGKTKKVNNPTEESVLEDEANTVDLRSDVIPEAAIRHPISLEDAKLFMRDQFYALFSANKTKNHELIENAPMYEFFYLPGGPYAESSPNSASAQTFGTLYVRRKPEFLPQYNGEYLR